MLFLGEICGRPILPTGIAWEKRHIQKVGYRNLRVTNVVGEQVEIMKQLPDATFDGVLGGVFVHGRILQQVPSPKQNGKYRLLVASAVPPW